MFEGKLAGMDAVLNAWGVVTDGHGHLFVCDYDNACVQKFSARGQYLGGGGAEGRARLRAALEHHLLREVITTRGAYITGSVSDQ